MLPAPPAVLVTVLDKYEKRQGKRTLEALVLDQLFTAIYYGEILVSVEGDNIAGLEPSVCCEDRCVRLLITDVTSMQTN